jgi:hypothetical protein
MCAPSVGPTRHARQHSAGVASSRGFVLTGTSTDGIINLPGRPGSTATVDHPVLDHQILVRSLAANAFSCDQLPLTSAEPDPGRSSELLASLALISVTVAGRARDTQLRAAPRQAVLQMPNPQFPTKTPAGRRSSTPVPPGHSVPNRPHEASSVKHRLRYARLPVRSAGQHLHPQLRRPPGAGRFGNAGSST